MYEYDKQNLLFIRYCIIFRHLLFMNDKIKSQKAL